MIAPLATVRDETFPKDLECPASGAGIRAVPLQSPDAARGAGYRSDAGARRLIFAAIFCLHVAMLAILVSTRMAVQAMPAKSLPVVFIKQFQVPPPPPRPSPPVAKIVPDRPRPIIVPESAVEVSVRPPPILTIAEEAPPPAPMPVQSQSPVAVYDLSATILSAVPPRYPIESRRKREQGTVVLALLVGEDGRVLTISLHRGSGSERLDSAAMAAVRQWRWSPKLIGGSPVQVRGLVEIPFVLKRS